MFEALWMPTVMAAVISGVFAVFVALRTKRMEGNTAAATVGLKMLQEAHTALAGISETSYGSLMSGITDENEHRRAMSRAISKLNEMDTQVEKIFRTVGPALPATQRDRLARLLERADASNKQLKEAIPRQDDLKNEIKQLLEDRLAFRNALREAVDLVYSRQMGSNTAPAARPRS